MNEGNQSTKYTLPQILELAVKGFLDDVRVSLPGRVTSYDPKTQRAAVVPLVGDRYLGEGGEITPVNLPVVTDVPVAFKSAGGYSETFPLESGTTGLLVVCSSSIARWKAIGGVVDPADDRHHVLPDSVFFPGLRDLTSVLADVPTDAWVITVPSGKRILLGSHAASQPAILGNAFMTAMDTLLAAVKTALIAAGNTATGGVTIGATFQSAIAAFDTAASTFKSLRVKLE